MVEIEDCLRGIVVLKERLISPNDLRVLLQPLPQL